MKPKRRACAKINEERIARTQQTNAVVRRPGSFENGSARRDMRTSAVQQNICQSDQTVSDSDSAFRQRLRLAALFRCAFTNVPEVRDFFVMSLVRFLPVLAIIAANLARAADAARARRVFFLISEPEYDTKTTLPAFAKAELEPRGIRCTFSIAPPDRPDDFPELEALKDADLLFVSVRRQAPPAAQMDLIRAHVVARKPVVGIRTASHAFALRGKDAKVSPGHADWPEFDQEVLGGNYHDHYGTGIPTFAKILPEAAGHPVLAGIDPAEFELKSHLYKNPDL